MKKSAWIFILSTSLLGACSTTKNNAVSSNLTQPQVIAPTPVQSTILSKSGKNVPVTAAEQQLMAMPQRALVKKKSDKTVEEMFDAATIKNESSVKN
jgi:hypothetical protein